MVKGEADSIQIHKRTSLRRADWRFLLPLPEGKFQHLVLLGGPQDLGTRILEAGIAQRVSTTLPTDRCADGVAILHRAHPALKDAVRCLKPGGVLYYEIGRLSPAFYAAVSGRLQRWLENVGLSPLGVYWAAPDFESCKRYIPLDIPEVFQWYLSTLYVAGTPLHRLIEVAMRLYVKIRNPHAPALAPGYAVTAVAGPREGAAPSVLGHPDVPAELQIPGLRPVLLTSGQDDGSRVIMLPFVPGCKSPIAVYKISTLPNFNENTEREQAVLQSVREGMDETLARTLPRPLGYFRYGDLSVSIENYVAGHPILVSSGRWRASFKQQIDDLRLAANWLKQFHHQVQVGRLEWNKAAITRWIEKPLEAYDQTFGSKASEKQLFSEVRQRAVELIGESLPIVWVHYDFGPWNIYRNKQEFAVIDWEYGRYWEDNRYGPSLYDLLYFVTYWVHLVQHLHSNSEQLMSFYRLFINPIPADKHAAAVHQILSEYMAEFEIESRFLPLMLVYVWIEQALYQYCRKRDLGELNTDPRYGNRSVQYIDLLARHSKNFFNQPPVYRAKPG